MLISLETLGAEISEELGWGVLSADCFFRFFFPSLVAIEMHPLREPPHFIEDELSEAANP